MEKKFLELVAQDLLQVYGNNLSQVTMVMPGKRARLFMNQYLALQSERPVWSPQYKTIDELFLELSPYHKAEQIETVCLLYQIYSKLVDNAEPLDEFYSWGEIILSDFDDIDKHMAPAESIFANVYDLHALEESYLTEEQEAALKEFFSNFSIERITVLKERFLHLWKIMPKLYTQLREELRKRGMLYPGALYRDVVERLKNAQEDSEEAKKLREMQRRCHAFVGFNVVDECEESLFRLLGEEHTRFYWDYDEMYVNDVKFDAVDELTQTHRKVAGAPWEAGIFLRQNLNAFPNKLPREYFDNLRNLKDITFIATSTDNAQARHLPTWIDAQLTEEENDTAIVLCDEHMLQPVLHVLPEEKPKQINVTMGFPLTDTPIYSFLSILTAMQIDGWDAAEKQFRNSFKEKVKRHPYFALIEGELFEHQDNNILLLQYLQGIITELGTYYAKKMNAEDQDLDVYDQLYSEALYQTHKVLNRFITIIEDGTLDVHPITLRRLIKNVLGKTSIPFHGEPAIGMQVMGLMETRNLDFKHLLMMNVGEGTMPKKANDNSLIPYSLREAFGLTTIRHRISVFAYYFFRLIQRAEHVTLMYNENTSGVKNNEMSRFMRQLMAETNLPIRHVRLVPENQPMDSTARSFTEKTPEMLEKLKNGLAERALSPTAINTYLNCGLQFYFKYIAGIKVNAEKEDEITPAEFGTIFHNAAQNIYKDLMAKYGTHTLTADMIRPLLENKETQLVKYIDMGSHKCKSGLPLIIRDVIKQYLVHLLSYDMNHAPFTIESMETKYTFKLDIAKEGEAPFIIPIGGYVDRLDRTEEGMKVVDYKTGGKTENVKDMNDIFSHANKSAGYYFQTMLYSLAVSHQYNCSTQPTLFYVHKASNVKEYDATLAFSDKKETIYDVKPYEEEFTERLKETLRDLFNVNISFSMTDDEKRCNFCDFNKLCGKKIKEY